MDAQFYEDGLSFGCQRCSGCCRGEPGYVFLGMADLDRLREAFGLSRREFLARWCRVADFGAERLYSLKEKPGYDCIFWDGGCTVYESRPLQCRTYPFWDQVVGDAESWEREGRSCPGIGQGRRFSREEIEERLVSRRVDRPLGPGSPGLGGGGS